MSDRSFEEQVREEMAGLSLKPGTEVWEQIEMAIHKEKKRRWFIWLLLLLGGCGTGSFLFYHEFIGNKKTIMTQSVSSNTKQNGHIEKSKVNTNKEQTIDSTSLHLSQTKVENTTAKKISGEELHDKPGSYKITLSLIKTTPAILTVEESKHTLQSEKKLSRENSIVENSKTINQPIVKDTAEKTGIINDRYVTVTIEQQDKKQEPAKNDTVIIDKSPNQVEIKSSPEKKSSSAWQFAVSMDMGKSGIRQLPGQNAGYLFSGSTVSQPGAGSIGSATIYKTPSLTNGFSFGINMEANKMINKRTGFSISLGYQMYQSQIGIGNRIDSATFISSSNSSNDDGFYYLSTDERKYTNRYHFIQTGFSFYVDRVVAKIIPIRWHIGTGASFLLSSNALHYDAAKGILFRSRPLVNNFQLNLSAGFDMGIGKKPFFYIGPELTYFITHPSQHPGSTDQYLFRAGARAVYILPKKKK